MSLFVLIALAAAEVALVWMTCTKWSENPEWRREQFLPADSHSKRAFRERLRGGHADVLAAKNPPVPQADAAVN